MKGKKEGGEKKRKGGPGRKKEKERGEKKRRGKEKFHSRARTRNLPLYSQLPTATAGGRIAHTNMLLKQTYSSAEGLAGLRQ